MDCTEHSDESTFPQHQVTGKGSSPVTEQSRGCTAHARSGARPSEVWLKVLLRSKTGIGLFSLVTCSLWLKMSERINMRETDSILKMSSWSWRLGCVPAPIVREDSCLPWHPEPWSEPCRRCLLHQALRSRVGILAGACYGFPLAIFQLRPRAWG